VGDSCAAKAGGGQANPAMTAPEQAHGNGYPQVGGPQKFLQLQLLADLMGSSTRRLPAET
jgi:hypothetical protein